MTKALKKSHQTEVKCLMRFKNVNAATRTCNNSVAKCHSTPRSNWGSFRRRREEKWGSFRGRFGDHFRVGDHFGVGIISESIWDHFTVGDNFGGSTVLVTNNSSFCHPSNHAKVKNKRTGLYPVHILIYSHQRYNDIDATCYCWGFITPKYIFFEE